LGLTLRDLSFKIAAAWTLDSETEHALNKSIYHHFYLNKRFLVQGQISFGNSEPTIDDKACTTPFQKE